MKLRTLLLFIVLISFASLKVAAQNKEREKIDSIANISIPQVISNSAELIPVFFQNARKAHEQKMWKAEAQCYNNLRLMHAYLGRYDSSTYYGIQAIETFEKGGFKKEAAYIHCERGYEIKRVDLNKAEKEMLTGLAVLQDLNDKLGLAGQYNNYGVIKELKQELDSAQYYYQLSLNYKYELQDSIGIPYSILNIGVLAGMQEDYNRAIDSIKKAIVLFDAANNIPNSAESIHELAEIYSLINKKRRAIETFSRCIEISEQIGYLRLIKECHKRLSEVHEEIGDLKNSLLHQRQYNKIHDSLINETRVKEISTLETKFDVAKKEERIAKQQLKIKARNNQILIGLIIFSLLGFGVFYYVKRLRFRKKVERIEYENKMRSERERISRDLHDNIGSQLAFIISGAGIKQENKDAQLTQIASFAKDTLEQLRTTVWAIKKERIGIQEFADQVERFIEKIKPNSLIEFELQQKLSLAGYLSPTQSVHLFRIIQESISNAIKHSDCYTISINVTGHTNGQLDITVQDDGNGFDTTNKKYGNGLRFMKERLQELGGQLEISSSKEGTRVRCQINTTSVV